MFLKLFPFIHSHHFQIFEDSLETFVIHQALIAPFLLLFLEEAGIPLPIPGDIYLAFTGYQVSKGVIPYWTAFIFLLIAVLLGSTILYFISAIWGKTLVVKLGKYLKLDNKKISSVSNKFKKYGVLVIIFGRHIPGFRIPITVFSGISGVAYPTFIMSTFISVIFWIAFYMALGAKIGGNILRHFHSTPAYFILISIPFILFVFSIIYTALKDSKKVLNKTKIP